MTEAIIVALIAGLTSGGLSQLLIFLIQRKDKKTEKNPLADMVRGLGHDRIIYLGTEYLVRGSITKDEYENLHDYLYLPYQELGGNGTAEKIMKEVSDLPIK